MSANLAQQAVAKLVDAMHAAARFPAFVYLEVPAEWRGVREDAARADAAARALGPFAMQQGAQRFALRFVAGTTAPALSVQWRDGPQVARFSLE